MAKKKALVEWFKKYEIDSFEIFKFNKDLIDRSRAGANVLILTIPRFDLTMHLYEGSYFKVVSQKGSYRIPLESKPCNYGGVYYFFRCPACNERMRKLYEIKGLYLCRKCARLGYLSQRLGPAYRICLAQNRIKDFLKLRGGSLYRRPFRMRKVTFQKLRIKFVKYQWDDAQRIARIVFKRYGFQDFVAPFPDGLEDACYWREPSLL